MLGLFIFMFVRPIFCVSLQIISLFNNVPVDKKRLATGSAFESL
ncbi:unnamed protein product, partial [Brassica oleracea]